MVAGAAALWGAIGLFVDKLYQTDFTSVDIVAFRVSVSAILLWIYLKLINPDLLKVSWRDAYLFFGTGVLSIVFFNWSYFTAMRETSLSVAVVLLYTGPTFVVIMSRIFFGERITKNKQAALLFTLIGVVLVSELYPESGEISMYGLAVGVGAGFGYALYSIFSKIALKKYRPLTILFYTFLVASLFILPISDIATPEAAEKLMNPVNLVTVIGLAIFPTVLAYLLYTEGLKKIEAGKASITAMTEPVAATFIGIFMFGETLSSLQIAGIVLVMLSVLLIQQKRLR
ncbi:DMT family transporter [Rhodohalobacter halophilus]|uniref:DMT family transporter n=1 Tax=Rhodohalobacter halophilus TaxID=1812810 RepID=UPI00083F8C61|nr:EamA family transporter [Rhodohalobacter halophilus]